GHALNVDFEGAIVIIGATANSQMDLHPMPYSNNYWRNSTSQNPALMNGPEVHANIIATLNDGAYLRPLAWVTGLPMMLLFGAIMGLALGQLNRLRRTIAFLLVSCSFLVAHHFAWKYLCVEAFRYRYQIEILPMLFLGVFAFAGNLGVRWYALRGIIRALKAP